MITVLICDDDPIVRTALEGYLAREDDVHVERSVDSAEAALDALDTASPDVVLMDLVLPGMDGIAATRRISARPGAPAVMVLTTFGTEEQVAAAIGAGAVGFLLKSTTAAALAAAVRAAAVRAGTVITPELAAHLAQTASKETGDGSIAPQASAERSPSPTTHSEGGTSPDAAGGSMPLPVASPPSPTAANADGQREADAAAARFALTDRERDVLELVCEAESNARIAERLSLSESTVKSHVGSLMTKLDCSSRLQVAVRAFELGLVSAPNRRQ
ncbi:response regulator transcription factor [Brachybacterium sp. MASK1Z-5]|uniref:Response regulator transcription factor n=1 Tax=Brachybacterium halotolerans TaxID=2795215 RepID=A0ABS1BBB6_9MICO|nr:response regulator transcription factor [Brachybacterium halotolerans]MBK0331940.1 response regulator transcription factor [Brachybacterium halotolerans]